MKNIFLFIVFFFNTFNVQATILFCQVRNSPETLWVIEFDDVGANIKAPAGTRNIRWNSSTEYSYSFTNSVDNYIEIFSLNRISGTFSRSIRSPNKFTEIILDCKKSDEVKKKF